jgi:two-component system, sensor histidine kinase and response regulator
MKLLAGGPTTATRRFMLIEAGMSTTDGLEASITPIGIPAPVARRTERALSTIAMPSIQSEEMYRLLLANIPDVIWVADEEGHTVFVTPNIERIYGYTPEEISKSGVWFERIHPEDAPQVQKEHEALFREGKPFDVEYRLQRKDGRWIWIRARAVSRREQDGKYVVDGIASDITERKLVQLALEESEKKYRALISNIPDATWVVDAQGRVVFANVSPEIESVLGHTADLLYERGVNVWLESLHPDDAPRVTQAIQALFEKGEPYDVECRVRAKTGEWIWMHDRAVATREKDGMRYAHGLLSDITPRKLGEERLRASEERYRMLFQRNLAGILRSTFDGRILELNAAFAQILGYDSAEEVRALRTADLYYEPADRDPIFDALKAHKSVTNREVKIRRKDGSPAWVIMNLALIDEDGDEGGVVEGIAINITRRKQAEEELTKAKEAAEAASRAKSEFLANISHEIRTPLNGVIGMTELTLDSDLTSVQREQLNLVKTSAESLLGIINDILDFSKIEAGRLTFDLTSFNLEDLLRDLIRTFSFRAHQKGLELLFETSADVPAIVCGDPDRLRQILTNLVGNAIKFTERGEVILAVRAEPKGHREVTLHFSVRDTGIGVPLEKQSDIFKAFTQADGSITRRYGGSGLGLSISKRLVEMMGGRIGVESIPGQGSTFQVDTPFILGAHSSPSDSPEPESFVGMHVLVVDDNATNRRILQEQLRRLGCQSQAVCCADDALVTLRAASAPSNPIRLVIADAQMPVVDGFSLAERIQKEPGITPTTVIMLSSVDRQIDIDRLHDLHIAGYLVKPVMRADLVQVMREVTGAPQSAGATHHRAKSQPGRVRPLRILLAEDNAVNQKVASQLLRRQGHAVEIAATGRQALDLLEDASFDVVLMDVHMPDIDGFSAARMIRERESRLGGHLPIIAITACAMNGDRERCLAAGMDDYVSKPIIPGELFEKLAKIGSHANASRKHLNQTFPFWPDPHHEFPVDDRVLL